MANTPALIKQGDACRLYKAAKQAGFKRVTLSILPDGRIECTADNAVKTANIETTANSFDEVLE